MPKPSTPPADRRPSAANRSWVVWFEDVGMKDVGAVGGKNASLGEMIRHLTDKQVRVPHGFATTAEAYRTFLTANGLHESIRRRLDAMTDTEQSLSQTGDAIRRMILEAKMPDELVGATVEAYRELSRRYDCDSADVAVRSSATAEDLPDASFAGQQESFLNIRGESSLLDACRRCFASLYTDRAISYRRQKGYDKVDVALSVGIQKMVRSDLAGAGVMFTIDTDSGFPHVVTIDASWGLGESVVKGIVTPDEYRVFKPPLSDQAMRPIIEKTIGSKQTTIVYAHGTGDAATATIDTPDERRRAFVLSDDEILRLARWGCVIESHYGRAMDIEWAKDGQSGLLYIVQARPETVQSRRSGASLKTYQLKQRGKMLVKGQAIGSAISAGRAFVIEDMAHADRFEDGGILVTERTDPDWVPLMKRAAGIVTAQGGRTSHAAIVSRELSVTAIVGAEGATRALADGQEVTVSCAEGEIGSVYEGRLPFEQHDVDLTQLPRTRTKVMMNMASPEAAFRWWNLPVDGIGLARIEFIINNAIKIHPLALTRFDQLRDAEAKRQIEQLTADYADRTDYFVDHLARGMAMIAASRYPDPVIVRLSDFKTNEYANLIGGRQFEPHEENPMIGFRGASRYYSDRYRDGFALECRAFRQARERMGLTNIIAMVPFCRTPQEADRVLDEMAAHGLKRGDGGFKVYVMAEIPCNVVLAEEFANRFDGFSIGSNDLTQLVLGVDRDSAELAGLFDDRHAAIRKMIRQLIEAAHACGTPVGICGQAPSDHPDYAAFLVEAGIDSMSVNPDSVISVRRHVAEAERRLAARD